ncbi:MAG: phosphatase PAP2 family protein [Promethearchaeota archaeon]
MSETKNNNIDASRQKSVPKKKKLNLILVSYLISAIIFVAGVIIASIPYGEYDIDYAITSFISNQESLDSLGDFMNPSPIFDLFEGETDAWTNAAGIGQIFSEILMIITVIMGIVSLIVSSVEKSKAKKQKKGAAVKATSKVTEKILIGHKYYWYINTFLIVFAVVLLQIFKQLYGRYRPHGVFSGEDSYTPWYQPAGMLTGDSFFSGHVSQATVLLCFALCFFGSRRKILAQIFGVASGVYVFLMGLGRIASEHHWFTDVLFGGFLGYTFALLLYYYVLFIPDQEKIYRYKIVNGPFNEGYKLILEGKDLLKEKPDEAIEKIQAALQKFSESEAKIEELAKYGYDYSALAERIADLKTRFDELIKEYQMIDRSDEQSMSDYLLKWSYVF